MYSIEQRVFLVLEYHRLERSPRQQGAVFKNDLMFQKDPMQKPFARLFAKFERTGSVHDNRVGNVGPRQTVATFSEVTKVSGIIQQNPRNTASRIASETGFKRSSTQKILRNSRWMFPCEIQSH
ncbi:hypothetical protein AVEN_191942-1 [Araneus ventricosus]|uniref:Uncharacterized protein n=1 Tax=Araneus ventricosus TaxID=182803 RepID=A0A4Y2S3F3_ARAVE|nr:hypothetical protein AVEN_191942-1 [Araneus ventricosus]